MGYVIFMGYVIWYDTVHNIIFVFLTVLFVNSITWCSFTVFLFSYKHIMTMVKVGIVLQQHFTLYPINQTHRGKLGSKAKLTLIFSKSLGVSRLFCQFVFSSSCSLFISFSSFHGISIIFGWYAGWLSLQIILFDCACGLLWLQLATV